MRLIFVLLVGFMSLSVAGDKVPKKFRGVYQGTLSSFILTSGDDTIEVPPATVRITVNQFSAKLEIEGKIFDSALTLESVTKTHSTYSLDLPVPLKNSNLRIEKKGKKMEWQCPSVEDVILTK